MKEFWMQVKMIFVLVGIILFSSIGFWAIGGGYTYTDCYEVGTEITNPGNRAFAFYVCDVNGNYYGNFLRITYDLNSPEPISAIMWEGLSVWEEDPNYLVVDNAVYDPNSPDPNLYGSFLCRRNWGHEDWVFRIRVYDKADNNSCGECIISSRDKGKPKVEDFRKYQK